MKIGIVREGFPAWAWSNPCGLCTIPTVSCGRLAGVGIRANLLVEYATHDGFDSDGPLPYRFDTLL